MESYESAVVLQDLIDEKVDKGQQKFSTKKRGEK